MGAGKKFSNENFSLCPNTNSRTSLLVTLRSRSYKRAIDPKKLLGSTAEKTLCHIEQKLSRSVDCSDYRLDSLDCPDFKPDTPDSRAWSIREKTRTI